MCFDLFLRHLHKLPSLLSCDDLSMRIAAGETLALLFELARETDAVSECQQLNFLHWDSDNTNVLTCVA